MVKGGAIQKPRSLQNLGNPLLLSRQSLLPQRIKALPHRHLRRNHQQVGNPKHRRLDFQDNRSVALENARAELLEIALIDFGAGEAVVLPATAGDFQRTHQRT